MAATEEKVAQLREVTGVGAEAARQLLEAADGSLEAAVALHFGAGDDGPGVQASGGSSGSGREIGLPAAPPHGTGYGDSSSAAAVPVPVAATRAPQGPRLFTGEEAPGLRPMVSSEEAEAAAAAEAATNAEELERNPPQESGGWFSSIGSVMTRMSQVVLGIAPEDFEHWFVSRFGTPSPSFSKECFGDTVQTALTEERLLLLWFHQEEGPATTSLCRQILQNGIVLELATQNYMCWGGDVNRFEPGQIARLLGVTLYPTVVVLQPLRHGFDQTFCLEWPLGTFAQPLFRLSPTVAGECLNVDQALAAVTTAAQDHADAKQNREEQRMRRDNQLAEERQLREEQDREFQESMLMDQIREVSAKEAEAASEPAAAAENAPATPTPVPEAAATTHSPTRAEASDSGASTASPVVAAKGEEDSAVAAAAEEARIARGAEILSRPQPEPAGKATAKIVLKLPAGDRIQRVFRVEQSLEEVYDWAHCCRPISKPPSFELWTNFPAKALVDRAQTLGELGLAPSAALFMKAVDD